MVQESRIHLYKMKVQMAEQQKCFCNFLPAQEASDRTGIQIEKGAIQNIRKNGNMKKMKENI